MRPNQIKQIILINQKRAAAAFARHACPLRIRTEASGTFRRTDAPVCCKSLVSSGNASDFAMAVLGTRPVAPTAVRVDYCRDGGRRGGTRWMVGGEGARLVARCRTLTARRSTRATWEACSSRRSATPRERCSWCTAAEIRDLRHLSGRRSMSGWCGRRRGCAWRASFASAVACVALSRRRRLPLVPGRHLPPPDLVTTPIAGAVPAGGHG